MNNRDKLPADRPLPVGKEPKYKPEPQRDAGHMTNFDHTDPDQQHLRDSRYDAELPLILDSAAMQRRLDFALRYVEQGCRHAWRAAKAVGFGGSDLTLQQQAYKLLREPLVKRRIAELKAEFADDNWELEARNALLSIVRADLGPALKADGLDLEELDDDTLRAIQSVSYFQGQPNAVSLAQKTAAARVLLDFAREKREADEASRAPNGGALVITIEPLTPEQRRQSRHRITAGPGLENDYPEIEDSETGLTE